MAEEQGNHHTDIEAPGMHTWMVWRRNLTEFAGLLFPVRCDQNAVITLSSLFSGKAQSCIVTARWSQASGIVLASSTIERYSDLYSLDCRSLIKASFLSCRFEVARWNGQTMNRCRRTIYSPQGHAKEETVLPGSDSIL